MRFSIGFSIAITVLVITVIVHPMATSHSPFAFYRLRPLHPQLEQSLRDAYERSITVQRLVDEIEQSDLIVHIIPRGRQAGPAGSLRFVTTSANTRFLRMTVDETLPPTSRASLLGHELQHAAEVARATWVRDQDSFASLYRQIGYAPGGSDGPDVYDTEAARHAGAAVFAELRHEARRAAIQR